MTPASTARHFSYTHVENPSHSSLAMRFAFARLLASSATITQSLSLKRSLINIPKTEKTLHSSSSDIISKADYITGNFETLGSKFRHETEGLLPSLATISQSLFLVPFKIIEQIFHDATSNNRINLLHRKINTTCTRRTMRLHHRSLQSK